jgi:hypothetical protein
MSIAEKIHAMRTARPPATPPAIAAVCDGVDPVEFDGVETVKV